MAPAACLHDKIEVVDPFQAITEFLNSPVVMFSLRLMQFTIITLWLSLVVWGYRDASERGSFAPFWAAFALLFPLIGSLVYLLVRPPEYKKDVHERELEIRTKERELEMMSLRCPSCKNPIEKDFMVCPHCLKNLKKNCNNCGRILNFGWNACPYCGDLQEVRIKLGKKEKAAGKREREAGKK